MTDIERTEKLEALQRDADAARNRARYEVDPAKKAADVKLAEKCESEAKKLSAPDPKPAA